MGVTFCAVAPEHPLALRAAELEPGGRRVPRVVQGRRHDRGRARDAGQARHRHRPLRRASAQPRADPALGRQLRADALRRRRRDGRAGARRARLRVRASSTASTCCRSSTSTARSSRTTHWQDWYADTTCSVTVNSDVYSGLDVPTSRSTPSPPRSSTAASAASRPPGACATGASAGSATGARRSRSSIARPAASCRCRRRTCRSSCPRT